MILTIEMNFKHYWLWNFRPLKIHKFIRP